MIKRNGGDGDTQRRQHIARLHACEALSDHSPRLPRPPKIISIEELLYWAYAREKVHLARAPGLDVATSFTPRGFPGQASSERIGTAVGSSLNLGFEAPRDAYAVRHAVGRSGEPALVMQRALIGKPPDWTPYPVITWDKGPPIYGRVLIQKRRIKIIGYWVYARGDLPEIVDERRSVYGRWAHALRRLHAALSAPGMLADHDLADDLPPRAPWI